MYRLTASIFIAILFFSSALFVKAQFPVTATYEGGTGTSTAPSTGEILVGQGDGTYAPQATSTLGIPTHDPVTLGTNTASALSLSGQQLSLGDVFVQNAGDGISGNLSFTGTSANIALGSNYLSGDGGDEGVFVNSSGNVAVGFASPMTRFHVAGTSGAPSLSAENGISIVGIDGTNALETGVDSSSPFGAWMQSKQTGSDQSRILSFNPLGGNVGIGTRSPEGELDVKSSDGQALVLGSTFKMSRWNNSASLRPQIGCHRYRGTISVPAAVVDGDSLCSYGAAAWDGPGLQQ